MKASQILTSGSTEARAPMEASKNSDLGKLAPQLPYDGETDDMGANVPPEEEDYISEKGARPEEYQMPKLGNGEYTPRLQKIDRFSRNVLASAQFPKGVGSSLLEEAYNVNNEFSKMNNVDKKLWILEQNQILEKTFKGETKEKIELAQEFIDELESLHPDLKPFLNKTGIGHSANIIAQFAMQAERLLGGKKREQK